MIQIDIPDLIWILWYLKDKKIVLRPVAFPALPPAEQTSAHRRTLETLAATLEAHATTQDALTSRVTRRPGIFFFGPS